MPLMSAYIKSLAKDIFTLPEERKKEVSADERSTRIPNRIASMPNRSAL
jgi:hypothetical protein